MKIIYKIAILVAWMCLLTGCQHFLNIQPRNSKVVSSIEDYRDILASYMRLLKSVNGGQELVLGGSWNFPLFNVAGSFSVYTGEANLSKTNSSNYDSNLGEFTGTAVNRMSWMSPETQIWNRYYSFLGPINMIIEGIDAAEGDHEDLRNYVKGEALVWRAYAYYKLLQYYAPYQDDRYGIPVYLKPYDDPGNAMPSRLSQTEVYRQILGDCAEAQRLLEITPSNKWNCAYEPSFLHAMLADIYTYKAMSAAQESEDWGNALRYAEAAMKGRSLTHDADVFRSMFDCEALKVFTHDEFFIRLVDGTNGLLLAFRTAYCSSDDNVVDGVPDMDFYKMYKVDDMRKKIYFTEQGDGRVVCDKYNLLTQSWKDGGALMPFRLAEMYLIKAEALYRTGREAEARTTLDLFKESRYTNVAGSYTESDLLAEILKERKLEFYQENDFRWLDMKRLGVKMERIINGNVYVLEPDDFRYCQPIPTDEMKNNFNMVQTPGWDDIFF